MDAVHVVGVGGIGTAVGFALQAARVPVVFVAIHFGFAWGFWKEVARQVRAAVQSRLNRPAVPRPSSAP